MKTRYIAALWAGTTVLVASCVRNPPVEPSRGRSPSPDPRLSRGEDVETSFRDRLLTREAKTAIPARDAVKAYFSKHGIYPPTVAAFAGELQSTSATGLDVVDGWLYLPNQPRGFSLQRLLGHDSFLEYRWDGSADTWVFNGGDGAPEVPVKLQP